jgi:hypothetical protein
MTEITNGVFSNGAASDLPESAHDDIQPVDQELLSNPTLEIAPLAVVACHSRLQQSQYDVSHSGKQATPASSNLNREESSSSDTPVNMATRSDTSIPSHFLEACPQGGAPSPQH